jgi:hypothetical protein
MTAFSARSAEGDRALALAFYGATAVHPSVIHGCKEPIQGWVSREYGEKKAAPVVCATVRDTAPSAFITAVIPRRLENAAAPPLLSEELIQNGRGAACMLEHDGIQDLFIKSLETYPVHVSNFTFEGDFLWARSRDGHVTEALGINAVYASHGSRVLFENPSPVSCVNVRLTQARSTTVYAEAERSSYVRN